MRLLSSFLFTFLMLAVVCWTQFVTGDSIRWELWLPVLVLIFAVVYVFEPGPGDNRY
jgi:hypothetical protein